MANGTNGGSNSAPSELTTAWHARVKERQHAQLTQGAPVKVDLPGGEPVYAVRANVLSLYEAGRIPDALTPFVLDLLKTGRDRGESAVTKLLTDGFADWVRLMDAVWLACVTEPAFVPDGTLSDDAIPMRLVDLNDKIAFFNWSSGIDSYLDAFRESADDPRALPDGEGVRAAPGGDVGGGPVHGTAPRLPTDAGDVLRRAGGGEPTAADDAGSGATPGESAGRDVLDGAAPVDIRASRGAGATTGRGKRGERGIDRGTGKAATAGR